MAAERSKSELTVPEISAVISTMVDNPVAHFAIAYVTPDGRMGHMSSFAHRSGEIGLYSNVIEDLSHDIYEEGDEH
jgi:formylmethanofuran:tetrahydromethanopterin formyltransferase